MLRVNNVSHSVFEANGVADDERSKVRVNGKQITRKGLVASGRLVALERIGKLINQNSQAKEKYNSVMEKMGISDYNEYARLHKEQKLIFCATKANEAYGKEAPTSFDDVKKNLSYWRDPIFLRTMAEIDREVIDPLFFSVIDSVGMGLMQWESVGMGETKEITIRSNDVFLLQDSSWGSSRSVPKNYLYAKTVTLTPKVYSANATIKWYQDIVNGDAGMYYAALVRGMYNKIYAKNISGMKAAISGGTYVPANLTAQTYTTQNWITITDKVAEANGLTVDSLMAIGTRSALSNVLPVDGTGGAITGLQYGLGEEWFKNGFLPKAGGVDLFPVSPVIVPGTQNSTIETIDTGNDIYILPKASDGYAPMRGVYAEGSPIDLVATASETADFTIDINFSAIFDIQPLFASKIGVITSVYPSN